jgi:hypothetical protein
MHEDDFFEALVGLFPNALGENYEKHSFGNKISKRKKSYRRSKLELNPFIIFFYFINYLLLFSSTSVALVLLENAQIVF